MTAPRSIEAARRHAPPLARHAPTLARHASGGAGRVNEGGERNGNEPHDIEEHHAARE
ncbi:MAG TPA: hypothetical protein VL635_08670 [Trinickia sp.]|nr:hypothetical protein [Trinickia sp.]